MILSCVGARPLMNCQNELAIGEFITAWQGLLRLGFCCLRQTTMRSTFGISELQRRNTSGVQAARCSAVPSAKLEVVQVARVSATATEPAVSFQIRFMTFSCLAT